MNSYQYKQRRDFVFSELQSSGLEVQSEVYATLVQLFSEFKTMELVRDQSTQKSIDYFEEVKSLRRENATLNRKLEKLAKMNRKVRA